MCQSIGRKCESVWSTSLFWTLLTTFVLTFIDTVKLTKLPRMSGNENLTHIRALDALISPRVSEISLSYILILKLSILIISAHNLGLSIAYCWFYMDPLWNPAQHWRVSVTWSTNVPIHFSVRNPRFGRQGICWTYWQLWPTMTRFSSLAPRMSGNLTHIRALDAVLSPQVIATVYIWSTNYPL
jgi:hypothetical protein